MIRKPHIFRANGGWLCQGARSGWYGATPREAYTKWRIAEKFDKMWSELK